jgi:putative ABC transport system permease protein
MQVSDTTQWVGYAAGLLVLTLLTMGVARWAGVGLGWLPLRAVVRAAVQLSIVALLLRGILAVPWTVALFMVLMLATASSTSAGRLKELWHGRRIAATGVVAGTTTALAMIFALRLVDVDARYVVATGGIVIGNAMSAATLSGRNFARSAIAHRDEIEGWLSLGASPSLATLDVGREAAREALLPNLDQTRATGLVTLPGAFVGALFGGASPAEAARFQLVVLAGIALAMIVTAVVVTRLLGRSPVLPVPILHTRGSLPR